MTAALMAGRFRHARNVGFLLHCVICMSAWKEKTWLEGQYPQQLHQLGLLQPQLKLQSLCDGCADGGAVQARQEALYGGRRDEHIRKGGLHSRAALSALVNM